MISVWDGDMGKISVEGIMQTHDPYTGNKHRNIRQIVNNYIYIHTE